jgi:hypothetical protein
MPDLTPDAMLRQLDEHGMDAGSDLNDGDLMGWFGWRVKDDVLAVTYEPSEGDGPGPKQTASWRLIPVEDVTA